MRKGLMMLIAWTLMLAAAPAMADLCDRCKDMMFTADIGKCVVCGKETSSSAKKLCPECSKALKKCEVCQMGLKPATQPSK